MRATRWAAAILAIGSVLASFASAGATDQVILGQTILIKDPIPPDDSKRTVKVQAYERQSSHTVVGDPTVSGATVRILANGGTPSDQTWTLPASGWRGLITSSGSVTYRYRRPKTLVGEAVYSAEIKRYSSGTFKLEARAAGKYGPLTVFPPNPGTDAALVITIGGGGDTYCAGFGGAAGGLIKNDPPGNPFKAFAVKRPTSELGACPP